MAKKTYKISTVRDGDVHFIVAQKKKFTLVVHDSYIECKGIRNRAIFNALNIPNAVEFASEQYGYPARDSDCPEFKSGDMRAATRLINAFIDLAVKGGWEMTDEEAERLADEI